MLVCLFDKNFCFFFCTGCLQHEDGTILKPVQVPPKGQTEVEFYEEVFGEQASTDKVLLQLRELVPKFHAIVHAPKEPNGKYFTAKYVYALEYFSF